MQCTFGWNLTLTFSCKIMWWIKKIANKNATNATIITTEVIIIPDHSSEKLFIFAHSTKFFTFLKVELAKPIYKIQKWKLISYDYLDGGFDFCKFFFNFIAALDCATKLAYSMIYVIIMHKMSNAKCTLLAKKIFAKNAAIFKSTQYSVINQPRNGRFLFEKRRSSPKGKMVEKLRIIWKKSPLTISTL